MLIVMNYLSQAYIVYYIGDESSWSIRAVVACSVPTPAWFAELMWGDEDLKEAFQDALPIQLSE